MDNEIYSFALKNTLNEIQKICPDIKTVFIFNENGEIIAGDDGTSEDTLVKAVDAFDGILEKADSIDGVEGITLDASKGRVKVSCIDELFLVTVTDKKANVGYVDTLTRVLVPTIVKLLEKLESTSTKSNPSRLEESKQTPTLKRAEDLIEEPLESTNAEEQEEHKEAEAILEPVLPEPPTNQFIVENIGGLLVPADTVRVDNEILQQWKELYEDKRIEEVEIETFGGKSMRCKIKPIKDSKYEGKGIIQMPDKIQFTLEIKKGELVRVKPIII